MFMDIFATTTTKRGFPCALASCLYDSGVSLKIKLFLNSFHFSENFHNFHVDGADIFESAERVTA